MQATQAPNSIATPDSPSAAPGTAETGEPTTEARRLSAARWIVPGIFLLGLVLRVATLDAHSLWYDEVLSIETAQRGLNAIFIDRFGWMLNQPPLHYILVWLSVQPVDPVTTSMLARLPSALAGSLTVLVVYGLGKELFGRTQGIIAALLVALSTVSLTYSQDLRPYAILTFLTTLSVYCLVMSEHTGEGRWWLAFTVASIANLANAYLALSLVLPALAPFLAVLIVKSIAWGRVPSSQADTDPRPPPASLIPLDPRPRAKVGLRTRLRASLLAIAVASSAVIVDMLQVPRVAPDLRALDVRSILASPIELVGWFTQFGIGGQTERLLQLLLCLVSFWGLYLAVRAGRWRGALLCASLIVIPATILAVLGTTNPVFQRYALFAMPVYFLLIANGLVPAKIGEGRWAMDDEGKNNTRLNPVVYRLWPIGGSGPHFPALAIPARSHKIASAATIFVVCLFALGDAVYFDPVGHSSLAYRPDYRGVADYLRAHVAPNDIIVFTEADPTVSTFYWHGSPPVPAFAIIDPRLPVQRVTGSIYWIAAASALSPRAAADYHMLEVGGFEGLVVTLEKGPVSDVASSMERFTNALASGGTSNHAVQLTRGSIYQSRGDIAGAVRAYKAAGTQFSVGVEHLRTAEGFSVRGDSESGWREAIVSKGQEPEKPAVHYWFARQLSIEGYTAQSRIEAQIAQGLQASVYTP
jgi:hypothetical protein